MTPIEQILDLARWAPSGDNTQPWRFQIESEGRVTVLAHDTRQHCVYDLDGHASQISVGALLETICLAATRFGFRAESTRRDGSSDEKPVFDIKLCADPTISEDPLVAFITERRVQRRPMHLRPLRAADKDHLERAIGPQFTLRWFDSWRERARVAWINFITAKIRLTIPEAYAVHRAVIEWGTDTSEDRIPSGALGASAPTLVLMRWAMQSWARIAFLNRYLGGTIAPRVELDLLPGLACAAHCVLLARTAPSRVEDYLTVGRALQRLWLTATMLGLQFQPEYTPLVFARYARTKTQFSSVVTASDRVERIRLALDHLIGSDVVHRAAFMGRIASGPAAKARSLRLPLSRLLQPAERSRTW